MNYNAYIFREDMPSWITKYFDNPRVSMDELIFTIEELDHKVDELMEVIDELRNHDDDYEQKRDWDLEHDRF